MMRTAPPKLHLLPHNQVALERLTAALEHSPRAAVIQPTGTGKSFIALAFIEAHPKARFVYLSPSTYIFDQLQRHAGETGILRRTVMMTYQRLCMTGEAELTEHRPDYIILDEFHRCGAEEWGGVLSHALERCGGAKLIGLTATPIRYLDKGGVRDMAEELFGGAVAHSYSIRRAMDDGILPVPQYILADIYMAEKVSMRERAYAALPYGSKRRSTALKLIQELRRNLSDAEGIEAVFQKHLPGPHAKLIVFCRNIEHIARAQEDMRRWLIGVGDMRFYVCRSDDGEADAELTAFIQDKQQDAVRLLFCVNMLTEGLHVKDVDGIVMLRPTASPTVYLQQIGRCLAACSGAEAHPVVFDLVNNYESARIDGGEQRVFTVEFLSPAQWNKSVSVPIPFKISSQLVDFQTLLDKFDHFVSNKGRWEYLFGLLQEFLTANGRYPAHRDLFHGVGLGNWLSHQLISYRRGALSAERAEALAALPDWADIVAQRSPKTKSPSTVLPDLEDIVARRPSNSAALNCEVRHQAELSAVATMLAHFTQTHEGANPSMHMVVDGYPLGRKVNRLRQERKQERLSQAEIDTLSRAGMIWELRRRAPALSFDTYYTALSEYRAQAGHTNVPQTYVVPGTNCKLGLFVHRMRLMRKGRTTGKITAEQIAKLNLLGMVWDATANSNVEGKQS